MMQNMIWEEKAIVLKLYIEINSPVYFQPNVNPCMSE